MGNMRAGMAFATFAKMNMQLHHVAIGVVAERCLTGQLQPLAPRKRVILAVALSGMAAAMGSIAAMGSTRRRVLRARVLMSRGPSMMPVIAIVSERRRDKSEA